MTRLRIATVAAALVWLALVTKLMIADLWDETNGMLAFCDPAHSLGWKLHFVLTQSLGFWRPLPTLIAVFVLHAVRSFDVNWRLLRFFNAAELLGSVALLTAAITRWSERDERRDLVFIVALLFSGSAVITAGWYANIFDASALLAIAAGLWLLARGRAVEAGLVFGVGFFCKETTALVLPFLLLLLAAKRITFRDALRCGIPAAILGASYFAIRARIVPFGSSSDIHGFPLDQFLPTLTGFAESFWRQTLKGNGPGVAGFLFLAVSLAALRKPLLIGAAALFLFAGAVVYWQMFVLYQDGNLISHLDFFGRLYLIPVTLMLVVLAAERRTVAMLVLLIPIVFGAFQTYRDHSRMQRTYSRIYRTAAKATTKPLVVDYAEKPLHDTVRGVEIGNFPDAPVKIDPQTGRLLYR